MILLYVNWENLNAKYDLLMDYEKIDLKIDDYLYKGFFSNL